MSVIKRTWGDVELDISLEKASYNLKINQFQLTKCQVCFEASNLRYDTSNWSIVSDDQDKLIVAMNSELGNAQLTFASTLNKRNGINNRNIKPANYAQNRQKDIPNKNALVHKDNIPGIEITLELDLVKDMELIYLIPLFLPCLDVDHLLVHGRKMGGCRMIKTPAETDFSSVFQGVITKNDLSLQFAHPLRQKNLSEISGKISGHEIVDLKVSSLVDPCVRGKVISEPVSLFVSNDGHALMNSYGEEEQTSGKKVLRHDHGWNSWDYYRWTITEEEVLKNAEFIKNDPVLCKYIKRITIDDGWQYCYGEWDANPLFPNGMKYLAEKLTEMGFEPGLWIAPTIIEPHCRLAQVNSEMMAMGVSGNPCIAYECMRRYGFVLDPTREDSQKWLHDLFARYVDMGYKFFKLDFLAQTQKAKKFFDKNVPRGEIMGKIVAPIREATKNKAKILGCNYSFEAGDTLVDSVRTSGDIHSDWNCIKSNAPSIAARFWMQDSLWDNDPDFALCRGPETSDDPAINDLKPCLVGVNPESSKEDVPLANESFSSATLEEAQVLLGLVVISGGCINLSDNLCRLNEAGLDLLRRTVAAERGKAGIPLDLFKEANPGLWIQEISNGYRIMLINWSEEEQTLSLELNKHGIDCGEITDFWTDEIIEITNSKIERKIAPHACFFGEIEKLK